jgi:hypothetical protein
VKRKCVLYIWGLVSAILAYKILEELAGGALGKHGGIVAGLIFGLSPGSVFGIAMAERILYGADPLRIRGIIQALLFGLGGTFIGSCLLEFGGVFIWFVPAVVALTSLCGFYFRKPISVSDAPS